MDKTSKTDATVQLSEAINKLEAYTLQASQVTLPTVSKTISMMRSLFMTKQDIEPKKHNHQRHPPDKKSVERAAEFVTRQRLFIEKLREGSPDEQELAHAFTKKIDAYNKSCDIRIQNCIANGKGLAGLLRTRKKDSTNVPPKIALPQKVTVQRYYPENAETAHSLISSTAKTVASIVISKQSAELFQMKALSLLERYGIATNPEAREHVKISPIHAAIESGKATCILTQTLSLFPGQTIVIKGTSALDPQTQSICRLFPETFCLSLESTQTGFPHPSQRAGWSLTHQLLPENPQRIDMLGTSATLFKRRAEAIAGLLPQGGLLKKAKIMLAERKICFQIHKEKLIDLHRQLALAIHNAAQMTILPVGQYEAICKFYDALESHPHPFEWLTEVNHQMRECFITEPYNKLLEAILRGKSTDFGNVDPDVRYRGAQRVFEHALEDSHTKLYNQARATKLTHERVKLDYIRCLGIIIGRAARQVLLQYLSEDLIYTPPVLTPFERKIQAAAFMHLERFLTELENDKPSTTLKSLEHDILEDIAIFNSDEPLVICNELAEYYDKRYSSLKEFLYEDIEY